MTDFCKKKWLRHILPALYVLLLFGCSGKSVKPAANDEYPNDSVVSGKTTQGDAIYYNTM